MEVRGWTSRGGDLSRLTTFSASAMIFLDISRSFLSCAERAISDARRQRFSTYRVDIWAFNSSIRTLRV
jgi:hypothetical protein